MLHVRLLGKGLSVDFPDFFWDVYGCSEVVCCEHDIVKLLVHVPQLNKGVLHEALK